MFKFFQRLHTRLKENARTKKLEATVCGKQGAGGEPPDTSVPLSKPHTAIVASHSGPDGGIGAYKHFAPDLPAAWDAPADWAYGASQSMYDVGPTGRRNGEPVADCFGILAYADGAILAVADGVNWGEPPRRAARCAVLGCLNHLHQALRQHEADSELDSDAIFRHMVTSIGASQKLILQQFGTLTTLVVSVVLPLKWSRAPRRWAAHTMTVGDSAAFVYRAAAREVEEVTAAAHADGARDPRWCPGALGYALGEEPDLSNMMLCLTFLDEGDIIFLTSDGVADNFDPVIRKMARHQVFVQQMLESSEAGDLPALFPAECQAKAMALLREAVVAAHTAADTQRRAAGLTARALADHLLQHVYEVTEEQRQQMEARNRAEQPEAKAARVHNLDTDSRPGGGGLMSMLLNKPPGKMDHATVAAYQVGRRGRRCSSAETGATTSAANSRGNSGQQQPAVALQPPVPQ